MVDDRGRATGFAPGARVGIAAVMLSLSSAALADDAPPSEIVYKHAYAFLAEPKYPSDFTHFDWVNPDAPKGGRMRIAVSGQWDNINPCSVPAGHRVLGVDVARPYMNLVHDALMDWSADEPASIYGRLAEGIAVADDGAWIAFKIRDGARWHDGKPVTIDDVHFTFTRFTTEASPTIATPLNPIESFEIIGPREIRFNIREGQRGDPLLPIVIGSKPILPAHFWASRDLGKTSITPPLGSGPYRVKELRVGRWIRYERVEDYWGRDLPVMRGRYNFDEVKWDYFRDGQIQAESIKGDVVDVNIEGVPRLWNTGYEFPAKRAGMFRQHWLPVNHPSGLWAALFWNLDQPRFRDVRVREALWLVADYEWINWRNYDFYGLAEESFFHGSVLASRGLPSDRELKHLEPIRDLVPPRVFTEPYRPPPHGGRGWHRDNLVKAAALLKEAGWIVKDGRLVHGVTGERFHVRLVVVPPGVAASIMPYLHNLERLGITSTIKSPETSQWVFRMLSGDFDGGGMWFITDFTPTHAMARFSSAEAGHEYGANYPNIRDPAVDHLLEAAKSAGTWDDYVAAIRAFDRVMLWNFYLIPGMSRTKIGIAHWNRYDWVDAGKLSREVWTESWWWDEARAARVAEYLGE